MTSKGVKRRRQDCAGFEARSCRADPHENRRRSRLGGHAEGDRACERVVVEDANRSTTEEPGHAAARGEEAEGCGAAVRCGRRRNDRFVHSYPEGPDGCAEQCCPESAEEDEGTKRAQTSVSAVKTLNPNRSKRCPKRAEAEPHPAIAIT